VLKLIVDCQQVEIMVALKSGKLICLKYFLFLKGNAKKNN